MNTLERLIYLSVQKSDWTAERNYHLQSFSSLTSLQMSSGSGENEKFLSLPVPVPELTGLIAQLAAGNINSCLSSFCTYFGILVHILMKLGLS